MYAKSIMEKYGVPTCGYRRFTGKAELTAYVNEQTTYPLVIKLDGLAAGKGVGIPETREEALAFIEESVVDGQEVFVEDYVRGEEASVLGICDGKTVIPLVAAQDHKRVFDGDRGPNTGGMGAYAPAPRMTPERMEWVREHVLQRTVDGMAAEGIPFKGVLYAGIIFDGDQMKVLEFNVRFGDPETQVILPLLEGKLGDLFQGACTGTLDRVTCTFKPLHAITVVMASGGYPGPYEKGVEIWDLERVSDDVTVFHAGTTEEKGRIFTAGGRVLNVTATGPTLTDARNRVYREIQKITFAGSHYRTDIAHRAL
jgi:phosphoribosylamine---glycine ligase